MGENSPEVGERVAWIGYDGDVTTATVIAVVFWDLVDLMLEGGTIIRGVRRITEVRHPDGAIGELPAVGRFARMKP